ncbi:hypothetical protein [Xanthomonas axonopodis]|uniref:hypothetical protein n=1 Tax=Xanthomonas axonopodis TaxID=53413 RepID=UPI00099720E0|nr:hypothetical protein [Xanthomonas axonopodis]
MELQKELSDFYVKHGFGPVVGARKLMVPVYTGCMLVPMPNIESRHRYLKYHDLHHLVTGYSVGRIGEGEVSAWELGTGSLLNSPILALMNLIALSTGFFLRPGRMWQAFVRGTKSKNIYSRATRDNVDSGKWKSVSCLRGSMLEIKESNRFVLVARSVEFFFYVLVALAIHFAIAIPAVIVRLVTDVGLGYSFFQVVSPKRRNDLF